MKGKIKEGDLQKSGLYTISEERNTSMYPHIPKRLKKFISLFPKEEREFFISEAIIVIFFSINLIAWIITRNFIALINTIGFLLLFGGVILAFLISWIKEDLNLIKNRR